MDKIEKKLKPVKEEIAKLKAAIQTFEKTAKQHVSNINYT